MSSPQNRSATKPAGNLGMGCLGAILIHPLLFILAFLKGFVLGSAREYVMSATGGSGPTKYLFAGGLNAMGNLFIYYIFVGFVVIPIASIVGSVAAIAIGKQLFRPTISGETNRDVSIPASTAFLRPLMLWVTSLYIASFCFSNLLFQFGDVIGWSLMRYLFTGTHWGTWFTGAILAYRKHQDRRISAWLIGIAVLVSLPFGTFLRISLFAVSIGTLLYLLSYPSNKTNDDLRMLDPKDQEYQYHISGLSVFAAGGFTYYALICVYCLCWAISLNSGGADWAPLLVLILGLWGIPIFGGIVLLIYRRTRLRNWAERRSIITAVNVWLAVAVEVVVCVISWLGVALYG